MVEVLDTMNSHSKESTDRAIHTMGYEHLDFASIDAPRLTHSLFRFPAKFHPPVAHSLVRSYTAKGQTILDPFCGSGTLLLAAATEGRHAVGTDIDPLAVFITKVKTHRFNPKHLRASWSALQPAVDNASRSSKQYEQYRFADISHDEYQKVIQEESLWVPDIPNITHWFQRYVLVDLSRMLHRIDQTRLPRTHRAFFRLMFASIIRKASNADPVPVSGLEVTAYMKKLALTGRRINSFDLFRRATDKGLAAVEAYCQATSPQWHISVAQTDATSLTSRVRRTIDAVITSPPYHNAVDYYRRHKLEMFWLGLTATQSDRLELLPKYIGRANVRRGDPLLKRKNTLGNLGSSWDKTIRQHSADRADAFVHYMVAMKDVFGQLAKIVHRDKPVVFVLGHSEWNGSKLPTSELFLELAGDSFHLERRLFYPVKNRYMSYSRHNGADINEECVLVFRRN